MEKTESNYQTAQEIIDTCEEKLTPEEIKKIEDKVNKDIENEVKKTVKKLN